MKKYLLQQPKTLEILAMARVVDWVTIQVEDLMPKISQLQPCFPIKAADLLSRRTKDIRNHIQKQMPSQYYNEFTPKLMKAIVELLKKTNQLSKMNHRTYLYSMNENSSNAISQMIEIVLTKNLTFMVLDDHISIENLRKIEYNTWDIFKFSFLSQAHMLSGLVGLKLRSYATEDDIIQLLKQLPNLKYLSIGLATDNVKYIADNCKLIENLDLSFNHKIKNRNFKAVTQLRHLKHINLKFIEVITKNEIVRLLLGCENIESICVTGEELIESALEHIVSAEEHVNKQFKLTSYNDSSKTTTEQLKLVVKMCPRLQSVKLNGHHTSPDYLLPLRDLTDLRHLTVRDFDFYSIGVKDVIQARGSGLEQLGLYYLKGMDFNALTYIFRKCPNLKNLIICACFFETKKLNGVRIGPLKYLKKITLSSNVKMATSSELMFMLSNCPNVEFVDICEPITVINEIMIKLLKSRNLRHLKELKLHKTSMIYNRHAMDLIIQSIIQNCVGKAEVIICNEIW